MLTSRLDAYISRYGDFCAIVHAFIQLLLSLESSPALLVRTTTVKLATGQEFSNTTTLTILSGMVRGEGENECCDKGGPWFCKQLPQPTQDDIEVRVCTNSAGSDEDAVLEQIKLYRYIQ